MTDTTTLDAAIEAALEKADLQIYEVEQSLNLHIDMMQRLERKLVRIRCDLKRAVVGLEVES